MKRDYLLLLPVVLAGGCFSPSASVDADTDTASSEASPSETETTSTPEGSTGTSGPQTGTSGSPPSTSTDTTGDPTVNPTSDTEGGSETSVGGMCSDSGDCGSGVCVDMECVPCGEAPDPDSACAEADAALPLCSEDGTACVACTAESCGGDTPVCDPAVGCAACTEHSHCPDSACHLGGPEQGTCFDVNDVVEVSTPEELLAAADTSTTSSQLVIRVLPGDYTELGTIFTDEAEVAFIGSPGTTLGGGYTNLFIGSGPVYISSVSIDEGPARAISIDNVWLDDVSIENYDIAVWLTAGRTAHIRRSQFRNTQVAVLEDASLTASNTDFGPQGDAALHIAGNVDLRYVTVAGNTVGLNCELTATGVIRNSILVNPGQTSQGFCDSVLTLSDNASDDSDLGQDVGSFDSAWFTISTGSRFFLSPSGETVFAEIADWDEGDPRFDIEGDPRPTRERGYPGVDEP